MKTQTIQRNRKIEFGDFQTPVALSEQICVLLKSQGVNPKSVIEPTCGKGSFIIAGLNTFGTQAEYIGNDINETYLRVVQNEVRSYSGVKIRIKHDDFFQIEWHNLFKETAEPILVIGNPPWVTNSEIGAISGANLPAKSNFQKLNGFEAITGKSNFDISEWMLIHLLYLLQGRDAVVAMLCKTSVARRVLRHAWRRDYHITQAAMHVIDAKHYFNISVDACLLVCKTTGRSGSKQCRVYQGLSQKHKIANIGIHHNELLADFKSYREWSHLDGREYYKWRSGVKHDCAKIMEFILEGGLLRNGLGEICDLEDDFLYGLFKSSSVAKNEVTNPQRRILVTQKRMGEDTSIIEERAPKTWNYLLRHSDKLSKRKSSIYLRRPRFSIFGIGEYSFAPWKVAISGLYKKINFSIIGSCNNKPAMVDDTCYFIPCHSSKEAHFLAELLNSEAARLFFNSFIFWDSKRPITLDILRRIDLAALANELGKEDIFSRYKEIQNIKQDPTKQAMLF